MKATKCLPTLNLQSNLETTVALVSDSDDPKELTKFRQQCLAAAKILETQSGEEVLQARWNAKVSALYAERRLGQLLGSATHGGDRKSSSELELDPDQEILKEIPKTSRNRFRQLASIPIAAWEAQLEEWEDLAAEPTQAGMVKLAEKVEAKRRSPTPVFTKYVKFLKTFVKKMHGLRYEGLLQEVRDTERRDELLLEYQLFMLTVQQTYDDLVSDVGLPDLGETE